MQVFYESILHESCCFCLLNPKFMILFNCFVRLNFLRFLCLYPIFFIGQGYVIKKKEAACQL